MRGSSQMQELKSMLISVRKQIGDTDEDYPHIKAIINNYWDK
jgi:hypothetical protein